MVLLQQQNQGQQIIFLLVQPKILPQQPNVLLVTKHFVVVTKYFCYPYFNKRFCWYNKTFFSVYVWMRCMALLTPEHAFSQERWNINNIAW